VGGVGECGFLDHLDEQVSIVGRKRLTDTKNSIPAFDSSFNRAKGYCPSILPYITMSNNNIIEKVRHVRPPIYIHTCR